MTDRSLYYDRNGRPIGIQEFHTLHTDMDYKVVARDELNGWLVSTVWLGIDHGFSMQNAPVIFETMVFPPDGGWSEEYQERYATEDEAREGHQAALAWTRGRISELGGKDGYTLRAVPTELRD